MATLEFTNDALVVTIEGMDKILALRSSITVPLTHITGVTARPDVAEVTYLPVEARFRGVHSPGRVLAGTLVQADGAVFFDVHDPAKAVAIELQHDEYKRLIVEASGYTPEEARERILAAVGERLAPAHG